MRRYLIFCLLFLALFLTGFTWEGELNPDEFDKWKVVSAQPTPQGFLWMFVKNADEESPIDIAAMAVDINSTLIGYRYFKYGEPYSYIFDRTRDKYVRYRFTVEEKESCKRCHNSGSSWIEMLQDVFYVHFSLEQ